MKKVLILLSVITLLISTTELLFLKASAGAPKIIYEVVEGTTKSMIKAVEARKGFKVVEGGTSNVGKADDVTQAIAKGLQEGVTTAAQESWQVINGGKFDSTPLKGMPGWMKVTLGTAAFITSADIAFDIYDNLNKNPGTELETLKYVGDANGVYKTDSIAGWEATMSRQNDQWGNPFVKVEVTIPNHGTMVASTTDFLWTTDKIYLQLNENGSKANIYIENPQNPNEFYSIRQDYRNGIYQLTGKFQSNSYTTTNPDLNTYMKFLFDLNSFGLVNSYHTEGVPSNWGVVTPVIAPNVDLATTPEIDTTKDTQTLIIPDPAYHPDLDLAINNNREMVSDPDKWLKENPEHDPTTPGGDGEVPPEETPPKEPGITNPFKNFLPLAMLLALLDLLVAILMYLVRMFEFFMLIPFTVEKPIPNEAFIWFRNVTWLGIKPYSLVMTLATFFMGFMAYKSIRRLFP